MSKWILGARLRTLSAAVAPVLVGSALTGSSFNWFRAVLALQVALWLQIGVNFANDYSDGVKGVDNHRIGPTRLVASGLASAGSVRAAALICFVIASISGLWLAFLTSPILIAIGVIAIAAAWSYTGGRRPYGYSGYGELSVFIFFGLVATVGTFYVQTETVTVMSFIVAVPMGALSCAILTINNLRDLVQDELVGKKTQAVQKGDSTARRTFIAFLVIAHTAAIATFKPAALLTLLTVPLTLSLARAIMSGVSGKALIPLLGKTGKLQLSFSIIFALALAI
ncbi:MAG: 1,4-dihydroxy-2-naphthoate polyprenyltransferase [Actinobacteria bacterium]|nr:1,4-dihydroxy-2-naphthoate polyprenyltransferase [Candidatus Planktophila sp.]PHX66901.1 MAG: 1,4-dihydroxy-2-naphthoate polyprenyltransferase [Actinomycetota bacterium]